ncbi:GDNF family receptor alpha-like [Cyclopterus lumpus]|uniref:GDNF family receptor alpha-like n=1 Tax=Cyclopterus lumpus TaxID=8103 RepID=UPI0014875EC7|nr:GDNF family receptor alpha-like [Cyclopterus lumpus]
MQLIHLEAAVIFGIVIPHISSLSNLSPPSDCLAAVDTCMSNLCKWSEEAFYDGVCEDEGCQIKGSAICNLTIQTVLDQFPSLHGCVCAWEEERCGSIQALATQCHQKPVGLNDNSASCLDKIGVCLSDGVCNRYLAPVLQACMSQCDRARCQSATQQFYGNMPHNVAEMLVMCECDTSDHSCLEMTTALHSGTCGGQSRICQDTVNQCVEDSNCRDLLKTFRVKCWSPEEAQCSDSDLQHDECISRMDPAFIRGEESECRIAFLATLGTALHYPCACKGMRNDDMLSCNIIHDVLHNRSHFMTPWKSSSDESEQGPTWSHDYLMYAFVTMLLVGVVLIPVAVASKIWMLRRKDKIKFHHPQKSNCVVIL